MKDIFLKSFKIIMVTILLFFITENYLSLKGNCVAGNYDDYNCYVPGTNTADYLLGWTSQCSKAKVSGENNAAIETVDEEGRRVSPYVVSPISNVLVLGCSFTFGYGVSDYNTFIWKAGEHFSDTQFYNYAVIGYGTHQCRIMMHDILDKRDRRYSKIFYFFIQEHLRRNIGFVFYPFGDSNYVAQPWTELVNNKPEYHAGGPVWFPGCSIFRTVAFFRSLYIKNLTERSFTDINQVQLFNAILDEMLSEANARQSELYICFLERDDKYLISQELRNKGLHVLNMSFPDSNRPQFKNRGVAHPNAAAHAKWAEIFCQQMQGKM